MLQFVTQWPAPRPIAEQVKEVVAGGCRWIELNAPGLDLEQMRAVAQEIVPVCREADAFVIMRQHTELAAELRLHGMLLDYGESVAATRRELGGEAVIGVKVTDLQQMMDLRHVDVDYYVMDIDGVMQRDYAIGVVAMAAEKQLVRPIVAEGEFDDSDIRYLMGAGFSGIALSKTLASAPDPAAKTRDVLALLHSSLSV